MGDLQLTVGRSPRNILFGRDARDSLVGGSARYGLFWGEVQLTVWLVEAQTYRLVSRSASIVCLGELDVQGTVSLVET